MASNENLNRFWHYQKAYFLNHKKISTKQTYFGTYLLTDFFQTCLFQ